RVHPGLHDDDIGREIREHAVEGEIDIPAAIDRIAGEMIDHGAAPLAELRAQARPFADEARRDESRHDRRLMTALRKRLAELIGVVLLAALDLGQEGGMGDEKNTHADRRSGLNASWCGCPNGFGRETRGRAQRVSGGSILAFAVRPPRSVTSQAASAIRPTLISAADVCWMP